MVPQRRSKGLALLAVCLSLGAVASHAQSSGSGSRSVLFDGLGMQLAKSTDGFTDKTECLLTIGRGGLLATLTATGVIFTHASDKVLFAPDEQHLGRAGTGAAVTLMKVRNRNALVASNPDDDRALREAIINGEEVKVRFFDFPRATVNDVTLQNPNVGYVHRLAVTGCGWADTGRAAELAPVKTSVYLPKDPDSAGYATVSVIGNPELGLHKEFDRYGGGCWINVGVKNLFGMKGGHWVNSAVDLGKRTALLIRGANGEILFSEPLPTNYNLRDPHGANPWPRGLEAAAGAMRAGPLGTIELDPQDTFTTRAVLYGFPELWAWGVQNCGFPRIQ